MTLDSAIGYVGIVVTGSARYSARAYAISNKVLVDFGKFQVSLHQMAWERVQSLEGTPEMAWIQREIQRGAANSPARLLYLIASALIEAPSYEEYEGRKNPKFRDLNPDLVLEIARIIAGV